MLRKLWLFPTIGLLALLNTLWAMPWLLLWPTRARRARVACVFAALWSRQVLWVAGVRLTVEGRERFATRPAVFLWNHVNNIDFFVHAAIAPSHALVFGKRELVWVPIVGWMWWLGGHPMVKRGQREQWKRVMDEVEARIREDGSSAYIAPEGTRSHDGTLGPFKKGAFVVALHTRAPVVPVVVTGMKEIAGKGGIVPGQVRVKVMAPVRTEEWTEETLDARIEEVRRVFLRELGQG